MVVCQHLVVPHHYHLLRYHLILGIRERQADLQVVAFIYHLRDERIMAHLEVEDLEVDVLHIHDLSGLVDGTAAVG